MRRKIAAILAADVAGYSRLVARDEEGTVARLATARDLFEERVAAAHGRIFNTAGDSVMCAFDSAVEAVRCAILIQEVLRADASALSPEQRFLFRMGISLGDVVEQEGDLFGDAVNLASRLEGIAEPGGICLTRSVQEAVENKIPLPLRDLGPRTLKNIPQAVHVFRVAWPAEPEAPAPLVAPVRTPPPRPRRRAAAWLVGAGTAALAASGVAALWFAPGPPTREIVTEVAPAPKTDPTPRKEATQKPAEPARKATAKEPPAKAADAPAKPPEAPARAADAPARTAEPQSRAERPSRTAEASKPASPDTAKPANADAPRGTNPEAPRSADAGQRPAAPPAKSEDGTTRPTEPPAPATRPDPAPAASDPAALLRTARNLEEQGAVGAARQAYHGLVASGVQAIDAHLGYASLLRAQDGSDGPRDVYGALKAEAPSRAVDLVLALQRDAAERRQALAAFAAAHPDYAPVHYLLAEEAAEDRSGAPTAEERRARLESLRRFLEADREGRLAPFFLDPGIRTAWVERARREADRLEAALRPPATPTATFTRSGSGWIAALTLPEPAVSVSYGLGDGGTLRPTGHTAQTDPRTGKPYPVTSVPLPGNLGPTTLYVAYTDPSGRTNGPYPLPFDPRSTPVEGGRRALDAAPWVTFRPGPEARLGYEALLTHRCAIREARIGVNDEPPDRIIPLPPCDPADPAAVPPGQKTFFTLPEGVEVVSAQIVYADGSTSEVRQFRPE